MRIDLVLFDLDDVLVDYRREVRCRTLGERIGRGADAVHAALFGSGLETEADHGRIDTAGVARALSEALGTPVSVADCVAARAAAMTPRPAVLTLVEALAGSCGRAILTNNGTLVRDHFDTRCPAFAPHFAGRVRCSGEFCGCKPDPAVYLRCATALAVDPARVLFVDDREDNVDGARRAGMMGHHYRSPASLHAALAALGLLPELPAHVS